MVEKPIPDNFRAFMIEVAALIDRKDEATTLESDDLLQTKGVYGGLLDGEKQVYGFTLFVPGFKRGKWEIMLTEGEIRSIAEGTKPSFRLWMCKNPECGCGFSQETDNCFDCDWKEEGT